MAAIAASVTCIHQVEREKSARADRLTPENMTQSTRKLLGLLLILGSLVVWSALGTWIYMNFFGAAAWWAQIVVLAIVGTAWFFPAAWIIRWMSKPDA
jgi:Mg2+/Co2+ transporter CorB